MKLNVKLPDGLKIQKVNQNNDIEIAGWHFAFKYNGSHFEGLSCNLYQTIISRVSAPWDEGHLQDAPPHPNKTFTI